jgi:hypothetical protein
MTKHPSLAWNSCKARPSGKPDFHDGHVAAVSQVGDSADVTRKGFRGNRHIVGFEGVRSIESESPEGMMLCALGGERLPAESQNLRISESLKRCTFLHSVCRKAPLKIAREEIQPDPVKASAVQTRGVRTTLQS